MTIVGASDLASPPVARDLSLQLERFVVSDVVAGDTTAFADGVLSIDVAELREVALVGEHLGDVDIKIVLPGDDVRIINAIDAVEPRAKADPEGGDFPGLLSPPSTAGGGITHVLDGVSVVTTAIPVPGEPAYWREALFDMGGPAAVYSPLSALKNVVLSFTPSSALAADPTPPDNLFAGTPGAFAYNKEIRVAGLRVAAYLAQATFGLSPTSTEILSLTPVDEDLPGVVYLYQLAIPYVYGEIAPGAGAIGGSAHLPTPIHPNELLDGALVSGWNAIACMRELTYTVQNHAIVEDLYARHGQDLDFKGVVLFTNGDTRDSKERLTAHASNLAVMMGAHAAIISYAGGGHPAVDTMMVCQKLERRGVPTTVLSMEMAANPSDSGFVHFVPEADAIVSTGNYEEKIVFPRVGTVIGGSALISTDEPAAGPFELALSVVLGSTNQFGYTSIRGREY